MLGNTSTVRVTIPPFVIPVIAAGAVGVATAPVAGVAVGDTIIPTPLLNGAVIVLVTAVCSVPGTLDFTVFNPTAAPTANVATLAEPATVLKHTGSV
jgi:hypothetical protein